MSISDGFAAPPPETTTRRTPWSRQASATVRAGQRGDGGDEVVIGDRGLPDPREQVRQVEQLLARRLRWWEAVVGLVQQPVEELRVDSPAPCPRSVAVVPLGASADVGDDGIDERAGRAGVEGDGRRRTG